MQMPVAPIVLVHLAVSVTQVLLAMAWTVQVCKNLIDNCV